MSSERKGVPRITRRMVDRGRGFLEVLIGQDKWNVNGQRMGAGNGDGNTMNKGLESYLLWSMKTPLLEVKQRPFLEEI